MKNIKDYNQFIKENLSNDEIDINDLVEGIFDDIKEKFDISNYKKKANNIGVFEFEYRTSKDDKIKVTSDGFFIENDKVEIDKRLFDKIRAFFVDISTKEPSLLSDKKYNDIIKKYKNKYIKKEPEATEEVKETEVKKEEEKPTEEKTEEEKPKTEETK